MLPAYVVAKDLDGVKDGIMDIQKQIMALEERVQKMEEEQKVDVQKHVSSLERRVQILEKSLGERE